MRADSYGAFPNDTNYPGLYITYRYYTTKRLNRLSPSYNLPQPETEICNFSYVVVKKELSIAGSKFMYRKVINNYTIYDLLHRGKNHLVTELLAWRGEVLCRSPLWGSHRKKFWIYFLNLSLRIIRCSTHRPREVKGGTIRCFWLFTVVLLNLCPISTVKVGIVGISSNQLQRESGSVGISS